jgi:hypothetical protein
MTLAARIVPPDGPEGAYRSTVLVRHEKPARRYATRHELPSGTDTDLRYAPAGERRIGHYGRPVVPAIFHA